ncbi:MAG: AMP-binding protein [Paracoccaceae bacterium]
MTISISIARAAQTHPNHVAIRHLGADITWAQEADRVARLAGGLRALGLRAGDRLAILSANVPENMEITYAAIWAGIVIVPLNTRLAGPEIDDILRRSGSRFLAFDQRNAARAGALTTPLDGMVALEPGTDQPAATEFARLLASDPLAMFDAEADDLLGIYYTGGTTGTPKGVELTQNAFHIASLNVSIGIEV